MDISIERKIRKLIELNESVELLQAKVEEKKGTKKYLKKECESCEAIVYLSEEIDVLKNDVKTLRKKAMTCGEKILKIVEKANNESKKEEEKKYNILRFSAPEAVSNIFYKDLDESVLTIVEFDDILCTNYNTAYINGVMKYDPKVNEDKCITLDNINLLQDIAFRSSLYLLSERYDETQVSKILEDLGVFKYVKPVVISTGDFCKEAFEIINYLGEDNFTKVNIVSKDYTFCKKLHDNIKINKDIYFCSLIYDMKKKIKEKNGIKGDKLILEMQREYLDFFIVN